MVKYFPVKNMSGVAIMDVKELVKEIENLRRRMHELADFEGGFTPAVQELSRRLDALIVQYMFLEKKAFMRQSSLSNNL